ncbi:hypothetical protein [Maritalea porphyrae]|uniref:Uncharacterized protein n=2 Tax=Maritalea porphyrae TaxID=880732 RepID=A0ABQ5UN48_9HYPH|nr:hypothetical protein GCM10007879_08210 [Maritalea porphyrae]
MVIESRFWREDLAEYVKEFKPVKNPARRTERVLVNFEKDVTMALFMVRRLAEDGKFSTKFKNHRAKILRFAFNGRPHRLRYKDLDEYELENEQPILKGAIFVCNQFIHAHCTQALVKEDRNWAGLYTNSDFEKRKWIYFVPILEIVKILEMAVEDFPSSVTWRYDPVAEDWLSETD